MRCSCQSHLDSKFAGGSINPDAITGLLPIPFKQLHQRSTDVLPGPRLGGLFLQNSSRLVPLFSNTTPRTGCVGSKVRVRQSHARVTCELLFWESKPHSSVSFQAVPDCTLVVSGRRKLTLALCGCNQEGMRAPGPLQPSRVLWPKFLTGLSIRKKSQAGLCSVLFQPGEEVL